MPNHNASVIIRPSTAAIDARPGRTHAFSPRAMAGAGLAFAVSLFLGGCRVNGANGCTFSIGPGQSYQTRVSFEKGAKVRVAVESEHESDVDLFVYDRHGMLVAKDEYDVKNCAVYFTVAETQTYKVVVVNRVRMEKLLKHRNRENRCTLSWGQV